MAAPPQNVTKMQKSASICLVVMLSTILTFTADKMPVGMHPQFHVNSPGSVALLEIYQIIYFSSPDPMQ